MIKSLLTIFILLATLTPSKLAIKDIEGPDFLNIIRQTGAPWTLVNFWSTWCPSCVKEIPELLKLKDDFAKHGVEFVFVSMDVDSEKSKVKSFLSAQGLKGVTYRRMGPDEVFINSIERRWSGILPATVIFDASGSVVEFWQGETSVAIFRNALENKIKKEKP